MRCDETLRAAGQPHPASLNQSRAIHGREKAIGYLGGMVMNFSMTDAKPTGIPWDIGHSTPYSTGPYPGVKHQERVQSSVRKFALL